MKTMMTNSRVLAALLLATVICSAPLMRAATAEAQQQSPQQRVAEGNVVKGDAPQPGAVVYLKDTKSLAVRTYIADEHGHFRFGQLSQNADYEIWAEEHGDRSKSKSISSFDSKNTFTFTLKIN